MKRFWTYISSLAPKRTVKDKRSKRNFMLFSIRNKIFICFIVPIAFMIIVGMSAYEKAAEGMTEKYKVTSVQTVKTREKGLMTKEGQVVGVKIDEKNGFNKDEWFSENAKITLKK